jgi:hypothetical protein
MTTPTIAAAITAGAVTSVSLGVPSPHVCQVPGSVTYASARSFVEPTADNKAALGNVLTRLAIPGPLNQLLVSGHTDVVGSASANLALSQRRAASIRAVLHDDAAAWETIATAEGWGSPEFGAMVVEVGDAPAGDAAAIAAAVAAVTGSSHAATRASLFHRYFARLLAGHAVPAITEATPPTLGCGLTQPLRGSAAAPSRDPALPPITGDFRPNRRVEAYFTDGSASLTCAVYPAWTTACSLAPPAPTITVTLAPLDTVPSGGTADLQVTVTPSPLPAGSSVTLTITSSGSGKAVFDAGGGTTATVTASGPVRLRGTAPSSAADDVAITATIAGQPGPAATDAVTVTALLTAFLQFEVHNLTTHAFDPLPVGVTVDLMDRDPLFDDQIATATTTAGGRVFFNVSDLSPSGESEPDIFFLVHTDGRSVAGQTLPGKWSTSGWLATDGTPGLRKSFPGGTIGTPGHPVVFRIGVDVHVRFTYQNDQTHAMDPSPLGIPVELHTGTPGDNPVLTRKTDAAGEVHCVVFDVDAGDDLWFHLEFEMTDPAINLPRATVWMSQMGWSTVWDDSDQRVFPLARTSIGTQAAPELIQIRIKERNDALYMLKVLREWQTFLFHVTGGAWPGVSSLTIFRTSLSGVAYSWPVGDVNIPPSDHFDRATIAHELSHQIMWQEVDFSSLGIGYQAIFGDLSLYHQVDLLASPLQALIEGWAEFIEAIFDGTANTPPYPISTVHAGSQPPVPLGPPPLNRGESVEGAFADGLFSIWEQDVVTPAVAASARLPESPTGDLMATAASAILGSAAVRDRFLTMIWRPLQDLRPISKPESTDMIAKVRGRNPSTWHVLQARLQAFNMAMAVPTVTAVTPIGGPPAGGTAITVTGTDFTSGATVCIGANAATGVTVTSSTSLTAVSPPGPPGPADVVVHTASGDSAPLTSGFTYAPAPVVTAVTDAVTGAAARGSTEGGTQVEITGTGFSLFAAVSFGGMPATSVGVLSATRILATSPPHCPPGGVDVTVTNPDGQSGTLSPGFDYILVDPPPRIADVDPRFAGTGGGEQVTVRGTGFKPGARLLLGGLDATPDIALSTATELHALTPAHAAGLADVVVRNPDCQEDTVPLGFEFR